MQFRFKIEQRLEETENCRPEVTRNKICFVPLMLKWKDGIENSSAFNTQHQPPNKPIQTPRQTKHQKVMPD